MHGAEATLTNLLMHLVVVQNGTVVEGLAVHGNIEDVVCFDEVDILVKELDTLLVIQNAATYFIFAPEAFASRLNDLAQARSLLLTKLDHVLLLGLVHASIHADFYLIKQCNFVRNATAALERI